MFFIYGTDAPIYHYPIVTTVMVVLNVLIHLIVSATGYDVTPWILAFGDGFHPLQWVTHNFLHIGWLHLIGNMIFLFPFGLIVEGKIGWWRMLILYMAIGTFQGFTQQAIMLSHDPIDDAQSLVEMFDHPDNPMDEETKEELTKQWRRDLMKEGFGSLGASAVIFGLLAVCAVWAPVNEFDVYFRWSLLVSAPDGGEREWSVLTVCGIFVAKEFFMFLMMGMPISSEALHLNGFVVGAAFGMATLYLGLVDCEGFDLISLLSGNKFVSSRAIARVLRERQEEIEASQPQGPPQAIVPKLAHQLASDLASQKPHPSSASQHHISSHNSIDRRVGTSDHSMDSPLSTSPPGAIKSGSIKPGSHSPKSVFASTPTNDTNSTRSSDPVLFDADLPSFDDGSLNVDPMQAAKSEIEAMVASGNHSAAVRKLAEIRKRDTAAVLSASAMGKLAEGLIKENRVKPAMTVLTIGCDAYPAYAARWRIRLATIELSANRDPIRAIKQLRLIDKDELDSGLRNQYLKVAETARRMAGG